MADESPVYVFAITGQIAESMRLLSQSIVHCQDAIGAKFDSGVQDPRTLLASGGVHVGPGPRLEVYVQQLVGLASAIERLTGGHPV
jgi:hypothetical protein